MTNHFTLKHKCKIVVWMEHFESAKIVKSNFKKTFLEAVPSSTYIEDLHHHFMTTGSVVDFHEHPKNTINMEGTSPSSEIKRERSQLQKWEQKNEEEKMQKEEEKEIRKEDEEIQKEELIEKLDHDTNVAKRKAEVIDFVSISNDEVAFENQEFAQISLNEDDTLEPSSHQSFFCTSCGFETGEKKCFETHQRGHFTKDFFRCCSCSFTSNNTNLFRNHKKRCNGKDVDGESSVGKKLDIVSEQSVHTCDQCGKAYSSLASLKMHQAYHSKLRPFACKKCGYRFLTESRLKKHLVSHEKLKHLECPHCSFKCSMSGNMAIHMRTHTGEKPFRCEECPYRTANPSILRRHIAMHRNEIIFRCHQCNYKTHKSSLFASHEKTHVDREFKCHFCLKVLATSYALRYHLLKRHSEQENIECPFCDFSQADKTLVMIHIRRHTGEKPHVCPHYDCEFRAMRSHELKKHISKNHSF